MLNNRELPMSIDRHGLSIGIERVNSEFFLSLKTIVKLTHDDYQKITPMIDAALTGVSDAKINAFIDCSELTGWELRAAWDDFKLGLKHGREFKKVAVYIGENIDNKKWLEYSTKIASWFMSGECQTFESDSEALIWLQEYN
jgi:SpoIIAA-like